MSDMEKTLESIIGMTDKAAELIRARNPKMGYAAKAHYSHNIRIRNRALKALGRDDEATAFHFGFDPLK